MKQLIRLTEQDLNNIIKETVNKILMSEDGIGGGGATNAAGTMQGGGINPGAGQYDVPAFAKKKQKQVGGNAFSEPIRKPSPVGTVTDKKDNGVDMGETADRTPGFSVGGRAKWNKR